jgi:hypothetical protein
MGKRLTIGVAVLAACAVLLSLGTYVGAYYRMGDRDDMMFYELGVPRTNRVYNSEWHCKVFAPAAWVESKLSNRQVNLFVNHESFGSCVFSAGEGLRAEGGLPEAR